MAYYDFLNLCFSHIKNPNSRVLLELSTQGKTYSWGVAHPFIVGFKELGILHLLVLSGSQVKSFAWALNFLFSLMGSFLIPLGKNLNLSQETLEPYFKFLRFVLLFWAFYIFAKQCGWPPPLTRALLVSGLGMLLPRLRFFHILCLCLGSEILCFPQHLNALGFYLSWISFLLLCSSKLWKIPDYIRLIVLSVLCQICVLGLLDSPFPTFRVWVLWILSNLVLGMLFEKLLMPALGLLLGLSMLFSLAPVYLSQYIGHVFFIYFCAPFLESLAFVIIVAFRAFMYTN